jgi:hypothetical protein
VQWFLPVLFVLFLGLYQPSRTVDRVSLELAVSLPLKLTPFSFFPFSGLWGFYQAAAAFASDVLSGSSPLHWDSL